MTCNSASNTPPKLLLLAPIHWVNHVTGHESWHNYVFSVLLWVKYWKQDHKQQVDRTCSWRCHWRVGLLMGFTSSSGSPNERWFCIDYGNINWPIRTIWFLKPCIDMTIPQPDCSQAELHTHLWCIPRIPSDANVTEPPSKTSDWSITWRREMV